AGRRAVANLPFWQEADANLELGILEDVGEAAGRVVDHGDLAAGKVGWRVVPHDYALGHDAVFGRQIAQILQACQGFGRVEEDLVGGVADEVFAVRDRKALEQPVRETIGGNLYAPYALVRLGQLLGKVHQFLLRFWRAVWQPGGFEHIAVIE